MFKPWYSKKKVKVKKERKIPDTLTQADKRLWDVFSLFIRLRDTDDRGYGKCFTCPAIKHYTEADCGHGIGRQHKGTKYNEQNNHLQCKKCNGFEGGKREVYKEEMDKRYGSGTWDKMELAARATFKIGVTELDLMRKYYQEQVRILKEQKGMI